MKSKIKNEGIRGLSFYSLTSFIGLPINKAWNLSILPTYFPIKKEQKIMQFYL